jgi:plastocyanin
VPNTLLDGTAVKMRLGENLTSATAKAGDQVPFEVTEEVDVDGVPVIAKGGQALATVTDASPKKSMGRGGKLDVNVDSVRLIDGEKAQLRAVQDNKGGGHVGAMTGAMVATSIVFFPAAPLFLFVHGKDIVIPQGTEVTAFVQGDMKLDMAKFAPVPPAGAAAAAAASSALTIESSVANCDIEVDGSFMGNTPSTLNLAPGKHVIVVKKAGYKDWTRSMTVSSGTIRVSADMVAAQ